MAEADPRQCLDEAFDAIEESILPSLSMMIDALLEAAALARPGVDADVYAAELRIIGYQLEELSRQVEAVSPARSPVQEERASAA